MSLAVTDSGSDASALLLIHGWTCDHHAMDPVAEAFRNDYRIIAPDLLGHGASPKAEDYSIAAQAKAVSDVLDRRAVSNLIVIGHSMGAQIAVQLAVDRPALVRAAILLDPAAIIPHDKARAYGEDLRQTLQMAGANIGAVMRTFGRNQIKRAADTHAVDRLIDTMAATDPYVVRAAWDAIIDWPGAAVFPKVGCPMLLISAEKPLNRPLDLAKANPRLMTAQVAGSGHMVHYEVMDQVAAMICRFIDLL